MSISEWLATLGLDRYAAAFVDNGVDIDVLPELTEADLASMGVLLGHRRKILKAASELGAVPTEPTRTPPAGQRRQVTVLFADLSGYTELSSALDPEDVHRILNRYFAAADAAIVEYGGAIDKHMGDCAMGVFGAPVAHSDDPERALRAAADIHRAMEGLSAGSGRRLTAHIGIASGQVVAGATGSDRHDEYTVTGETVNLASRLHDLASDGETLVSDAIHAATQGIAEFAARDEVAVEGLDRPVRIWTFERFRDARLVDGMTDFVGRATELRQLRAIAEGVVAERSGHAVLMRGEAGIGKSRVVGEFIPRAESMGLAAHRAHVVDFGSSGGWRVLRELASSLLGLGPQANAIQREQVGAAILAEGLVAQDAAPFLSDLLDIPLPEAQQAAYAEMPSPERSAGIRRTLAALTAALAASRPRLLVIEDIHWADGTALDVLSGLAETLPDCAAMMVMTSRFEGWAVADDRLTSLRGCPLSTIDLQPLRDGEARRLLLALRAEEPGDLDLLVQRSGGNPLFLEQLTRTIRGDGDGDLPDTIHALVLAQVDRLTARDQEGIAVAAILGERLQIDALRAILGDPGYDCDALIRNRLLRVEDDEHVFCHALIRDGVIASLLRSRRAELHQRAAEHCAKRDLVRRAEHLEAAEAPEAAEALLAAAEDQAGRVRYPAALDLARRGAALAGPAERHRLFMLLGDLHRRLGETAAMREAFERALDAAGDTRERVRALIGICESQRIAEAYEGLSSTIARARHAAQGAALSAERARLCQLAGGLHFVRGEIADCLAENRRSLEEARAAGSRALEAQALGNLGDGEFAAGRMQAAHDSFDQCIALAREHGFDSVIAANTSMRGQSRLYLGRVGEALADCEAALALARRIFDPRAEIVALLCGVYVLEVSDAASARDWADTGIEIARRIGSVRFENVFREYQGRLAALEGERDRAERIVAEAVENCRQSEATMRFLGGRALGSLALVSRDPEARQRALDEGARLIAQGVGAHNPLWFHRDAIEVALDLRDWAAVERHAAALERYGDAQTLPWSRFFAERGRAIAARDRGEPAASRLEAVSETARLIGFTNALSRIGPLD